MGPERRTWLEAARLTRAFATTVAMNGRRLSDPAAAALHEKVAENLRSLARLFDAEAQRYPLGDDENTPPDGTALAMSRTPLAMPAPVLPDLPDPED